MPVSPLLPPAFAAPISPVLRPVDDTARSPLGLSDNNAVASPKANRLLNVTWHTQGPSPAQPDVATAKPAPMLCVPVAPQTIALPAVGVLASVGVCLAVTYAAGGWPALAGATLACAGTAYQVASRKPG